MEQVNRAYMPKSKSDDWETPPELFDKLWEEFGGFDLDPCCQVTQYTARRILNAGGGEAMIPPPPTEDGRPTISGPVSGDTRVYYDGLKMSWQGKVFMNPPHSQIKVWVEKAVSEVENGNAQLVVALLPARTDVKWWQKFILREATLTIWSAGGSRRMAFIVAHKKLTELRFLPGRLKFSGQKNSAPFPSAIVVWRATS